MKRKVEDKEIIQSIRKLWKTLGYAPSFSEMCEDVGLCRSQLYERLSNLRIDGIVNYVDKQARTITITSDTIEYTEND